jgi:hypothetical protein
MKSSLAKIQPATPKNDGELYYQKRMGWIDEEILVVVPAQRTRLPNHLVEAVIEIGNILYPKGK